MFVQSLYLKNFRNFEQSLVHFSPRINLIYGENAQGKTNLIEALYFLSTGRSFRTNRIHEFIREGEKEFYLEAHFIKDGIEQRLAIHFDGQTRKIQYNHTTYPGFTSLLGILPVVLYAPSDIDLINGGPAERRRFLDVHLAQIDPLYIYHLIRYHKAVKQRNCLLRQKQGSHLFPWESIMASSGHYLMHKRQNAIELFSHPLQEAMYSLSENKENIQLLYESSLKISSEIPSILEQIEKNRHKDLHLGQSLIGPHKDDLIISLDGKKAKIFSSEGQKRCSIGAIKTAEWHHLQSKMNTLPIMIVDDFSVHLDAERTRRWNKGMQAFGQVFLTSPNVFSTTDLQNVLFVKNGTIISKSHV